MLKPKHFILTASVITMVAIMAMTPEKSSSGAPAGHTGAPGETTCATSSCHDDNAMNSGPAILSVDLGSATKYVPGRTYPIKIRITEPSVERFGFQLVALVNSDSANAGNFLLSDVIRTQTVKSLYQYLDREYVTYTYDGTDAVSTGVGEWTLNWKAPASDVGNITFFASAVSANDDETDKGDYVYTKAVTIKPSFKAIEQ